MSKHFYLDTKRMAAWRSQHATGTPDSLAPLEAPLDHLDDIAYHTDLSYVDIAMRRKGVAVSIPSWSGGGARRTFRTVVTHNFGKYLFVHGHITRVSGVNKNPPLPLTGSVPIYWDNETGAMRWVYLTSEPDRILLLIQETQPFNFVATHDISDYEYKYFLRTYSRDVHWYLGGYTRPRDLPGQTIYIDFDVLDLDLDGTPVSGQPHQVTITPGQVRFDRGRFTETLQDAVAGSASDHDVALVSGETLNFAGDWPSSNVRGSYKVGNVTQNLGAALSVANGTMTYVKEV